MKFDVVICCGQKDYNKLPFCVDGVRRNIAGFDGIYIITPTAIDSLPGEGIRYFTDSQVLAVDTSRWKYRPRWMYQQFLKMFQQVSCNEYYVTIDADVILLRPLEFFDGDGLPIWYLGRDQNHKPYFTFQKKMLGFGRVYDHSFINDMNLLNRLIIADMLRRYGMTVDSFLKKSFRIINKRCFMAEPELYGNYAVKHFPGLYSFRQLSTCFEGKSQDDPSEKVWSDESIRKFIDEKRKQGFDLVALHSFCT